MGVQSIPAVFAFKDGRPVDGFMGALPEKESQIAAFIARGLVGETAGASADLEAAEGGPGGRRRHHQYGRTGLRRDPPRRSGKHGGALAGSTKCYIKTGDLDQGAEQTLALAPPDKTDSAPVASARAALDLARKAGDAGDVDALRATLAQNPDDPQTRFDLALALNASGDRTGALDALLAIVAKNRTWNDDAARKQLVQFFEAWGAADPATASGRQRLSSLLFA